MSTVSSLRKSKLLAIEPQEVIARKPKILIYGIAGVGKTWFSLDFPRPFYIDTEGGADLQRYRTKLAASGGIYLGPEQGSLDFETVISQVEALATEKHPYQTIVIDSVTKLFSTAVADEQARLGDKDAFGASKKAPIRQMAKLIRWINRADLNAVLIAHQRDEWGKGDKGEREVTGQTFDAWEKLSYELHLVLRISQIGSGESAKRFAHVGKSRLEGFLSGSRFDLTFAEFSQRYGRDVIAKEVKPIILATPEQLAELRRMLDIVKLPDGVADKWLVKSGAESFEEMDSETMGKCLSYLKEKMQ